MGLETLCSPISELIWGDLGRCFLGPSNPIVQFHLKHLRYAKHALKGVASFGHVPAK